MDIIYLIVFDLLWTILIHYKLYIRNREVSDKCRLCGSTLKYIKREMSSRCIVTNSVIELMNFGTAQKTVRSELDAVFFVTDIQETQGTKIHRQNVFIGQRNKSRTLKQKTVKLINASRMGNAPGKRSRTTANRCRAGYSWRNYEFC